MRRRPEDSGRTVARELRYAETTVRSAGLRFADAAVRIGALDLGIGNVLGSNLLNLLILGLDDVFYRRGPLLTEAEVSHGVTIPAVLTMNALFLIGLTYRVMTKRVVATWDTGAIAVVHVAAVVVVYLPRG